MKWLRLAVLGMAMMSLVGLADGQEVKLPDDDYPKLVDYAVTGIKDALKDTGEEANVRKAHTAAVMLAAYAQANLGGKDGQERATVRDAALKLAETIRKEKFADAVKQVNAIPKLKADPSAKKEKVKLIDAHVRFPDLMNQFDFPPKGGWGIDRELYAHRLGMKGKVPARDLNDKLMLMGYQVAVTGDLAHAKVPAKSEKEWLQFTADLRAGGAELADSVKKKDGDTAMVAIAKITTTCTNCHKIFRKR